MIDEKYGDLFESETNQETESLAQILEGKFNIFFEWKFYIRCKN